MPSNRSTTRAEKFRVPLLAWFAANQRDLPWRRTRDPYAIWISEAMLQQTRVETVIEYWRRFMQRFPSVRELAAAREDDVLALWSGLGYYRRARALHAASRAIVAMHRGEFPRDAEAVRSLPGVGPYTAGAVLSIAFDLPEALVDGNVVRVLSRWFAHDDDYEKAQRWAWEVARELVPQDGSAGAWNQALMELGATVCAPREPRCPLCPVQALCAARARGLERELPRAKKRNASVAVELETLIVQRGSSLLLERRPVSGRMAGLWQLPTIERGEDLTGLFPSAYPRGLRRVDEVALGEIAHTITHHRIRVLVHTGAMSRSEFGDALAWIERAELASLALTGMTRKILRAGLADRELATRATQAARKKLRSRRP